MDPGCEMGTGGPTWLLGFGNNRDPAQKVMLPSHGPEAPWHFLKLLAPTPALHSGTSESPVALLEPRNLHFLWVPGMLLLLSAQGPR